MRNYLVTVLVLAYNHEHYIAQTVESVLNQKTAFDFKLLITEDASTDSTRKIIQSYVEKNPTKVFSYINEKNLGLNETLKHAIPLIDTKYTCMMGGDDYWIDENKLQKQVDVMENDPSVTFVHTGYKILDESTNEIIPGINSWKWNIPNDRKQRLMSFLNHDFSSYPCSSSCCFCSEPFLRCFKEHPQLLDYAVGEGTLLHTAMCMYGNKYFFIPQSTIVYRKRLNSLSHYQDKEKDLDNNLRYVDLKVAACEMFGIDKKQYMYVVKNTMDSSFKNAYVDGTLLYYRNILSELNIDNSIRVFYSRILSNKCLSIVYFYFIKVRDRIIYEAKKFSH